MITLYTVPLIIGVGTGGVYACFFLLQQQALFMLHRRISGILFFLARTVVIGYTFLSLLRYPLIPSILGIIGFIGMFWSIIVWKGTRYERS